MPDLKPYIIAENPIQGKRVNIEIGNLTAKIICQWH